MSLPEALSAVGSFWSASVSIDKRPPEVILDVPTSIFPKPGVILPLPRSPTLDKVPKAASASAFVYLLLNCACISLVTLLV